MKRRRDKIILTLIGLVIVFGSSYDLIKSPKIEFDFVGGFDTGV